MNFQTDSQKVEITERGKKRRVSRMEALLMSQFHLALTNPRAFSGLAALMKDIGLGSEPQGPRGGVLIVPGIMDSVEWERMVFAQQAPYRVNSGDREKL